MTEKHEAVINFAGDRLTVGNYLIGECLICEGVIFKVRDSISGKWLHSNAGTNVMEKPTMKNYPELALRTMANQAVIHERNYGNCQTEAIRMTQLNNAARGMAGDVGEVNSCVQRCLEYGKELDLTNLKEELGDVLWRIVQACDAVGFTLEEVMEANIRKLAVRYPDKYSDVLAAEENRDRDAEKLAIEATEQGG